MHHPICTKFSMVVALPIADWSAEFRVIISTNHSAAFHNSAYLVHATSDLQNVWRVGVPPYCQLVNLFSLATAQNTLSTALGTTQNTLETNQNTLATALATTQNTLATTQNTLATTQNTIATTLNTLATSVI